MPARSSTRSPRRPQYGHRNTTQIHSSSSDSSSRSEESDEASSLEQTVKQDTEKRKGKRGRSVPKNLDSYEYRGKLIVVKRKPPVIFERDSSKSYDVEDMSKYYVGSEHDPYQRSKHVSPYFTDSPSRHWGACEQEDDIYYSPSRSRTNEILYDSGYYRVTDPGFRSPNVREIMNFKVSKNGQYLNHNAYQTTYDMMDGRGEFERALSGNFSSTGNHKQGNTLSKRHNSQEVHNFYQLLDQIATCHRSHIGKLKRKISTIQAERDELLNLLTCHNPDLAKNWILEDMSCRQKGFPDQLIGMIWQCPIAYDQDLGLLPSKMASNWRRDTKNEVVPLMTEDDLDVCNRGLLRMTSPSKVVGYQSQDSQHRYASRQARRFKSPLVPIAERSVHPCSRHHIRARYESGRHNLDPAYSSGRNLYSNRHRRFMIHINCQSPLFDDARRLIRRPESTVPFSNRYERFRSESAESAESIYDCEGPVYVRPHRAMSSNAGRAWFRSSSAMERQAPVAEQHELRNPEQLEAKENDSNKDVRSNAFQQKDFSHHSR